MRALSVATTAVLAAAGVVALGVAPASAAPVVVYDNVPDVIDPAYPSLGFQATSTDEVGDYLVLAAGSRVASSLTVGFTNWSCGNWDTTDPCVTTVDDPTFTHPITVTFYEADNSGAAPEAGAVIATVTEEVAVPFRPSASVECTGGDAGKWFDAGTATCYNGYSFTHTFDFSGELAVLDDDVIVGVAFNTQTWGASPTGVAGPYNSLNVTLTDTVPTVGIDENSDEIFWDTTYPGAVSNDAWVVDTDWTGYNLQFEITTDSALVPAASTEVTVYQKDVKPSETTETYQLWHEGKNNATPAYSVQPDGIHLGNGAPSTIIKGTDVLNFPVTKEELRALIIAGASIDVVSGSTTFQVPVFFGSGTPTAFTTLRSTDLTAGVHTFSLSDTWATTRAFGPYAAQEEAPLGELLDTLFAGNSVWLGGFGMQADSGNPAVVKSLTFDDTKYTFFQPELEACVPTPGPVVTNQANGGWSFADTRTQGTNTFVDGGLEVETFGNPPASGPDQRKAAGYKTIDIPLSDVGTPAIEIAPGYTGVRPSLQIGLDLDGNGSRDTYLVGEPWAYGGGDWDMDTNGDWADAEFWSSLDLGVGAGGGYPSLGTLAEYLLAQPEAQVVNFGYSLGSGVVGSAVIESITLGCQTTTFDFVPGTLTTAVPTITGTPEVGETLTADAGTWGPAPVALAYQWFADDVAIPGATNATYTLTLDELSALVTVAVTGSKDGFTSATTTSADFGPIDPETLAPPVANRLAGADRYSTAVEVSKDGFADGEPDIVYLATGLGYADALSAVPAAAHDNAPLLLTTPTALPAVVIEELERLSPSEVIIVGGVNVISADVAAAVAGLGFSPSVTRIAGADRYATSRLIADERFGTATTAYVATGTAFPDALSAGPAAAAFDGPVILINGSASSVDSATLGLMTTLGLTTVKIAGGTGAVSAAIESQLDGTYTVVRNGGIDRYSTAIAINEDGFTSSPRVFLATGLNFADALTGAALAGNTGSALYVSPTSCIPADVYASIVSLSATTVTLLGGTAVLSSDVENLTTCS
jgi:putative cell wall-binding protein